jgi:hypothetical protein
MRARKREGTRILELFVKGVAQAVVNIVPAGCGMVWPRLL